MKTRCMLLMLPLVLIAVTARGEEKTVTFASLLGEMVDREAAARFPDPAYTCRQQSSYDPQSKSADDPVTWMANNDWSHFRGVRKQADREESVMLDARGPGCVVRIWATAFNPRGTIRVYIDDQPEPAIEERVDLLIGGEALVGKPLSEVCARGMNFHLPIPYAKRCVITYDRPHFWTTGERKRENQLYYQINYRTYEEGTQVEPYSPEVFAAAKEQIAALQKQLLDPEAGIPANEGSDFSPDSETLLPGEKTEFGSDTKVPHAIRRLAIRLEAEDLEAATRSTVLELSFDGHDTVWCPVGDFFGSGVGVNPYKGWWRNVDKDGWMTCYWVMPYQKGFNFSVSNLGDQTVKVTARIDTTSWQWDDRSMVFHCNWRQEYPIDTATKHDWNYLEATGKGVFMGDTLALNNPTEIWWGEGDEKIYFDGEKFPSHFGTGTEDYYGYAWCTPEFFQTPFHAQPRAEGPRNKGHVTNTRGRLLDGIPFTESFRFDMEVWHWRPVNVAYAATTYWYGMPGAKGNHGPAPEQAKVYVAQGPKPRVVEGAIEGETLKIIEKTGGTTEIQDLPEFRWSNNKQLWWRDGAVGDKLVIAVPVEKAGHYALSAGLTKAIDYGIVRLSLDDKPLGKPLDLINAGVISKAYEFGIHQLSAGEHRLTIEITGANPRAVQRRMFGLDYLKLVEVP